MSRLADAVLQTHVNGPSKVHLVWVGALPARASSQQQLAEVTARLSAIVSARDILHLVIAARMHRIS